MFDKYQLISAKNLAFTPKDGNRPIVGVKFYFFPNSTAEEPISIFINNWHADFTKLASGMEIFVDFRIRGRNKVEFLHAFSDKDGKNSLLVPPKLD